MSRSRSPSLKKLCSAVKYNRRVPDFTCDRGLGHSEAHRDPATGTPWKHPVYPYGLRGPAKVPSARAKTKHGVTWSDRPARQ